MPTDVTSTPLVHTIPGATEIVVERDHAYPTERGPLAFELYRPVHTSPVPAVVFVSGYPDGGLASVTGKAFRDWASYQGWARMIAASGIASIVPTNRTPLDVLALVQFLRTGAAALRLDPARIGIWACSGHAPTALAVVARARPACAALLYPYLLDLDGATAVADAAAQFRFAVPPVGFDELPAEMPMLVVRAGRDAMPGLEPTLQRFLARARAEGRRGVTLLDHAEAPHGFDLSDDSPATHAIIEQVLVFLRGTLTSDPRT